MEKHSVSSGSYKAKGQKDKPLNFLYSLILLAYGYVTVLTPNLNTFDSNGPKFLAIALLNLVVFAYLFTQKEIRQNPDRSLVFFKSGAGIAYTLLMVVSLLSFFKAINVLESILHFCKIFTVFSAAYLVSVVVASDRRYLKHLAVGMTLLLLFDGFSVFYNVSKYIKGELADIVLIKTVYSNKNILAASIFVKLPFALWLFTFEKGWIRLLAFAGGLAGLLATFFMSSRAFYIGLFILSVAYLGYLILKYYRSKQTQYLGAMMWYSIAFGSVLMIFTLTQTYLYPKSNSVLSLGIGERLTTISSKDESSNKRLSAWKRSFDVIKQEPLLGCGVGNWKVVTLKDENKTNPAYIYQYKAHNDFIETTTEVGIFGGLFFLAIFVLIVFGFFRLAFTQEDNEHLRYLFLPAFGLMAYFFDAFFNFPQDRPEIQALLALYAGAGIALTQLNRKNVLAASTSEGIEERSSGTLDRMGGRYVQILDQKGNFISKVWQIKLLALLIFSAYILTLNFQSLKLQRLIKDEMNQGKLSLSSSKFLNEFPWVPDINVVGEPISAQKARYLINEKKYDQAIKLLKEDKASPYDTRPEYFIAMAYFNQGKYDSALIYNQKVYELKPYMFENLSMMSAIYERQGKVKEVIPYLEAYLDKFKDNSKAWMLTTQFLNNTGELNKAYACIDSAYNYFPSDTTIVKRREFQRSRALIAPHADLFNRAMVSYQSQKYDESAKLFTEFIGKEPNLPEVYEYRAFSYYFTQQYQASINDIEKMFTFGIRRGNLLNLRGVNLQNLGKQEEACTWYKEAMKAGNKDGTTNYNRFCGGGQKQAVQNPVNNPLLIRK